MDFHKEGVGTCGDRRLSQCRRQFRVTAAGIAQTAGTLGAVGHIEHDGAIELFHDRNRSHVVDQPVVSKKGAAFAQQDFLIAGRADLVNTVLHLVCADKLALFDVDRFACIAAGEQQVCLAT